MDSIFFVAYTYQDAIIGGAILALSTTLMLYTTGRVTGVSGIINAIISNADSSEWRWTFISGVFVMGAFITSKAPQALGPIEVNVKSTVLSGFLVGFGTQMGSGCTSGHGLCGIPRRSIRSLVAVLIFMINGAIVRSFIAKSSRVHSLVYSGSTIDELASGFTVNPQTYLIGSAAFSICAFLRVIRQKSWESIANIIITFCLGMVFTIGLAFAGMTKPSKVANFLDIFTAWDPSLAFVMGTAVVINAITFPFIMSQRKPLIAMSFSVPNRSDINLRLVIGSAIFGLGWGLGGVCPAPAIVGMATGSPAFLAFCTSMAIGMTAFHQLNQSSRYGKKIL